LFEYNNVQDKDGYNNKKVICRYGRGCTHIYDTLHRERFWHPVCPIHTDEQLRKYFICNECGAAAPSLQELQLHLKRKTAWSNISLLGCRISCLVDSKEWHEGFVTQYHKSGKHLVEFRQFGEKRWLLMKKIAFYIVERPERASIGGSEYKENDAILGVDGDSFTQPDENWVYAEDISTDYAFAQSVLFKLHGRTVQETGHKTKGHICLTKDDRDSSKVGKGSLLYGELLPRGANRAFGPQRLNVASASVLFDLGMGTGKICCQAFLQFRNLQYVYGVELSQGRYNIAADSALQMVNLLGADLFDIQQKPGEYIIIREKKEENGQFVLGRTMHFECGSLFDVQNIEIADIIMLETDITQDLYPDLCCLLSSMRSNARTLTYLDLRKIWCIDTFPFKQVDSNIPLSDRYPTSWSVQRGHHFYLWSKLKDEEISKATSSDPSGRISGDSNADFYDYVSTSKCVPINFLKILRNRWKLNWKGDNGKSNNKDSYEKNSDRIIPLNISSYEQNINIDVAAAATTTIENTNKDNNTNNIVSESDETQTISISSNGYNKKHHRSSKRLKSGNGANDTFENVAKIDTVKEESRSSESNIVQDTDNGNSPYDKNVDDNNGLSGQTNNDIEGTVAKIISRALSEQDERVNTGTEMSVESIVHSNYYAEQLALQATNRLNTNPLSITVENATSDAHPAPLSLTQTGFADSETMNTPQYLKTHDRNDIQSNRTMFFSNIESNVDTATRFYFNEQTQEITEYGNNNNNNVNNSNEISKRELATEINKNPKNSEDVCVIS